MKKIIVLFCSILTGMTAFATTPEEKLAELGITLTAPGNPVANYVHATRTGNLIYLTGKGPELGQGEFIRGKVGTELSVEEGYEAAKVTTIVLLGVLKHEIGELSKVRKIVRVNGVVNSSSDFTRHPEVMNGSSDLLVHAFDKIGKHSRVATGANSLPFNIAVEIDMIIEVAE